MPFTIHVHYFYFLRYTKKYHMVVSVVIGLSVNIHDTGREGLKNEKSTPSRPES